ncbi:MAG: MMPL family transporter [Actinomycetota bacterium]
MLDSLARFIYRRRRFVAVGGAVFFILAGAIGGSVASHLDPYGADDPATESVKAEDLLQGHGFREAGVIVLVKDAPVGNPGTRARVERIEDQLRSRKDVAEVTGYYDTGSRAFVSNDGSQTYVAVALWPTEDKARHDAASSIADQLEGEPGVEVGGLALAEKQVNEQTESDLRRAEMLAFPLLFLLSLLFFRSLVAALLPLLIGGLAIVGTFFVLRIASEVGSISIFALNLTTGLGLGLAIDYSLFIVSRYREELARRGIESHLGAADRIERWEALRATMRTAGRTVLFSSITVAAALASLIVFPQRFLYSMGIGGALVALLAAAVALIVLPAVLSILGPRVNALAPRFLQRRAERDAKPTGAGFWYRLSRFVMRRPAPIATLSAAFLIALGIPFLGIKFTSVDAQVLPESASARQVDDILRSDFPPFRDTPIRLAIEGEENAVAAVASEVRDDPGVAAVERPRRLSGTVSVVDAIAEGPFTSQRSKATVRRLRDLPEPTGTTVLVTGASAHFADFQSSLERHLPLALAIVVVSTLVVLFLFTGSVVLPIKALVMNVLNLSAVFGILVLVFQHGNLESLLDYRGQGALEQTMPILLFAVAFGLSTDYAVFLLSRIKEARDGGASDSESVAIGLERTGRIVTAAALLFSIAIGAFATSQIIFIKQNGIGTALAVLIDASIIRALLVPSLMELLGKWNWWAPAPLRRLHARIGLSEA